MKKKYFVFALLILLFAGFSMTFASKKPETKKLSKIVISDKAKLLESIGNFEKYQIAEIKKQAKYHFLSAEAFAEFHNDFIKKFDELKKILADDPWELDSAELPKNLSAAKDVVQTEKSLQTGKRLSTESAVKVNTAFKQLNAGFAVYTVKLKDYYEFKYQQLLNDPNYALADDWADNLAQIIKGNQKKMKADEVSSNELLFAQNFTKLKEMIKSLKKTLVKPTYRAGWDEFGIAWIMLFFGAITLYGGLFITITTDLMKNKSSPEDENDNAEDNVN